MDDTLTQVEGRKKPAEDKLISFANKYIYLSLRKKSRWNKPEPEPAPPLPLKDAMTTTSAQKGHQEENNPFCRLWRKMQQGFGRKG